MKFLRLCAATLVAFGLVSVPDLPARSAQALPEHSIRVDCRQYAPAHWNPRSPTSDVSHGPEPECARPRAQKLTHRHPLGSVLRPLECRTFLRLGTGALCAVQRQVAAGAKLNLELKWRDHTGKPHESTVFLTPGWQ